MKIAVKTEKARYNPGQQVNGVVYLYNPDILLQKSQSFMNKPSHFAAEQQQTTGALGATHNPQSIFASVNMPSQLGPVNGPEKGLEDPNERYVVTLRIVGEEDIYFQYDYQINVTLKKKSKNHEGQWRWETNNIRKKNTGYKSKGHCYFDQREIIWRVQGQQEVNQLKYEQTEIPFTFVLPSSIPSSFVHRWKAGGRSCHAIIDYSIIARIEKVELIDPEVNEFDPEAEPVQGDYAPNNNQNKAQFSQIIEKPEEENAPESARKPDNNKDKNKQQDDQTQNIQQNQIDQYQEQEGDLSEFRTPVKYNKQEETPLKQNNNQKKQQQSPQMNRNQTSPDRQNPDFIIAQDICELAVYQPVNTQAQKFEKKRSEIIENSPNVKQQKKELKRCFSVLGEQKREYSAEMSYKCCLCIPRGLSRIDIKLDQEQYIGGQAVTLNADIDNSDFKNEIVGFNNKFNTKIELACEGKIHSINVFKKIINKELVPAKTKRAGEDSVKIVVPLIKSENHLSTFGELIKCKHWLDVEVEMKNPVGCGQKNPATSFDLEICKEASVSENGLLVDKYINSLVWMGKHKEVQVISLDEYDKVFEDASNPRERRFQYYENEVQERDYEIVQDEQGKEISNTRVVQANQEPKVIRKMRQRPSVVEIKDIRIYEVQENAEKEDDMPESFHEKDHKKPMQYFEVEGAHSTNKKIDPQFQESGYYHQAYEADERFIQQPELPEEPVMDIPKYPTTQ